MKLCFLGGLLECTFLISVPDICFLYHNFVLQHFFSIILTSIIITTAVITFTNFYYDLFIFLLMRISMHSTKFITVQ